MRGRDGGMPVRPPSSGKGSAAGRRERRRKIPTPPSGGRRPRAAQLLLKLLLVGLVFDIGEARLDVPGLEAAQDIIWGRGCIGMLRPPAGSLWDQLVLHPATALAVDLCRQPVYADITAVRIFTDGTGGGSTDDRRKVPGTRDHGGREGAPISKGALLSLQIPNVLNVVTLIVDLVLVQFLRKNSLKDIQNQITLGAIIPPDANGGKFAEFDFKEFFLNRPSPASFCLFSFFSNNLQNENCRLQRDSNSARRCRMRAR